MVGADMVGDARVMITETHDHTSRCWWNLEQARWVCPAGAAVPEPLARDTSLDGEPPLVDVRDMIVVHTALLREFRLAPRAVARVQNGAAKRASVIDRHLGFLCELLHHHHAGEDDLLWPVLRQRVPAMTTCLIDEVELQHAGIDTALHAVRDSRARWTADPTPDTRDALIVELQRLHDLLKRHLDMEERTILPLAASLLTPAEWHAIGEAAVAAMPKSTLPLAFGMFAYEADPTVVRGMLATAPAVPRMLLPHLAPRVFARRATQVYGTPRP
jgi:hemerythrin-like domain-containing protein